MTTSGRRYGEKQNADQWSALRGHLIRPPATFPSRGRLSIKKRTGISSASLSSLLNVSFRFRFLPVYEIPPQMTSPVNPLPRALFDGQKNADS